jgi:hypothetical protein
MKNLSFFLVIAACLLVCSCKKDKSERFLLLTTPIWATDSLLSDGADASGPGQVLEKFKGDAKFRENGTGYFGDYKGKWSFNKNETEISIDADSLPIIITCNIIQLTSLSLKITTSVPNPLNFLETYKIRMTFKAK